MALKFNLIATDGNARRGAVETAHGTFQTPAFMAVGTAATVKALTMDQVAATGTQVILGNTYHLMMRPGGDLVEQMGGLHKFGGWHGPILTDSGGFQVMSLSTLTKMSEEGVQFTSHFDGGKKHFLRPEDSVHIQHQLDSNITMVLDECLKLPAELHDDAERLLGLVDLKDVLDRDGLEVKLVGRIVVGRHRLGVAVDDDRLVPHLAHRHRGVATTVVELDALTDAVRTSAQDHHLLLVVADRHFALRAVVGRIVVRLVLDTADRDLVPCLNAAKRLALGADVTLGHAEELREVLVAEAVLLRLDEHLVGQEAALVEKNPLLFLHELAHLVDEVALHARSGEDLVVRRALAQGLVHLEMTLRVRNGQHLELSLIHI